MELSIIRPTIASRKSESSREIIIILSRILAAPETVRWGESVSNSAGLDSVLTNVHGVNVARLRSVKQEQELIVEGWNNLWWNVTKFIMNDLLRGNK